MLHPRELLFLQDSKYIKQLGSGSFSDVFLYETKHPTIQYFVLKKTRKKFNLKKELFYLFHKDTRQQSVQKKFLNEYSIGICLNHPNIIKTLDIDYNLQGIYFEYFSNQDLWYYLQTFKLPSINPIYSQILDAVEYLHDLGIAHRDIKLENILIDPVSLHIKLIDFGEACVWKHYNHLVKSKDFCGTIIYIPPEEFDHQEYDPAKVDIWALGILLYILLYMHYPWYMATISDKNFKAHLESLFYNQLSPQLFPDHSYDIIFKMMLQKCPEDRLPIKSIKNVFNQKINLLSI